MNGVKTVLRKKQLLNVQYQNRNNVRFLDLPSTTIADPNGIAIEPINLSSSEQYVVYTFHVSDISELESVKNLKSGVKDIFKGKRNTFSIQYSEDNLKKVKEIIAKYPDKKVNWML